MIASRTCAVQILLVALSRRICCSLVWRARRRCRLALFVLRDADEPARHLPFERVAGCHEGGMGAAIAHGHAKALGTADRDISAPFAGGRQQGQCKKVGGNDYEGAGGMGLFNKAAKIADCSFRVRVLQEETKRIGVRAKMAMVSYDDLIAQRFGPYLNRVDCLGVAFVRDKKCVGGCAPLLGALAHHHCFGGGGGFVKKGGVGDVEGGQIAHHGLKVQQGFQPPLRNFGLVGRVLGVPAGILQDVAEDDRRRDGIVVADADEGSEELIVIGNFRHFSQHVRLRARPRQGKRAAKPDRGRDCLVDQRVERLYTDDSQHRLLVFRSGAQMTMDEGIGALEQVFETGWKCGRVRDFLRVTYG